MNDLRQEQLINLVIKKASRFEEYEPRHYIYRLSRHLIEEKWDNNQEIAEAVSLLLQIWNNACYRFGFYDINKLTNWINNNKSTINQLKKDNIRLNKIRERKYASLVINLFQGLIEATRVYNKKKNLWSYSPVGAAKALHLLLPNLFPLWDNKISKGMNVCWDSIKRNHTQKYLECCFKTLKIQETIESSVKIKECLTDLRGILKLIDEFNYIYFTKEKESDKERKLYPDLTIDEIGYIKSIIQKNDN